MKNKIFVLILSVLLISLFPPSVFSEDTVTIIGLSSLTSPNAKGLISIDVFIQNGWNVAGGQIWLTYNPSALKYTDFEKGKFFPDHAFYGEIRENNQRELWFTVTSPPIQNSGDGIIATLTFEVVDFDNASLNLVDGIPGKGTGTLLSDVAGNLLPVDVVESDDHSNTPAGATRLYFGDNSFFNGYGNINYKSDVDYFKVKVTETGELTVYSTGGFTNFKNNVDLVGQLLDSNGSHLATSSNDGRGPNFRIVYAVTDASVWKPKIFYVKVTEFNNDNIGDYSLRAKFRPLEETEYSTRTFHPRAGSSHAESVRCVAYSNPNGDVIAAGDNTGYLHVWDPIEGSSKGKVKTLLGKDDHYGDVRSIAFSPDGRWCAVGTAWTSGQGGGYLLVWENRLKAWGIHDPTWADPDAWGIPQKIHLSVTVRSVDFSHDSKFLACGTDAKFWNDNQKKVILFEKKENEEATFEWGRLEKKLEHPNNVTSVAFDPTKSDLLASGCDDGKVRLWNLNTNTPTSTELDESWQGRVHCIAFSRDGKKLAVGHDKGDVQLWSWSESEEWEEGYFSIEHAGAVLSLAFHPSGDVLVSCGDDKTISFWEVSTGNSLTGLEEVTSKISSITFSPQGNAVAIGTEGSRQTVGTWGEEVEALVYQFTYTGTAGFTNKGNFNLDIPQDLISEVAFSENATYFVLNLQFPELINGNVQNPIYKDCVITLDLPDVEQAPVDEDDDDPRLDEPLYFMYSLETPRQRIEAVENEGTRDTQVKIITSVIGGGIGSGIGFGIGTLLPGIGNALGVTIGVTTGKLVGAVIGSVSGKLIGVGLRWLWKEHEEPTKKDLILAETADPFFIIQPTEKVVTQRPSGVQHRVLFLIEKRITEIGITVEQAYHSSGSGVAPLYVAKYTHTWNLESGSWSAPRAQSMSLADYPPFQLLPSEEQAYLLRHFGRSVNVNAEQLQIPEETSLLPNYPNPFNPETWIPYQLASPADVALTIYDINGRIVQDLDLGHQRAGIYQSRIRAAHWDGRNALGEPVASGVYFYTLTADDFTATRKLLIRK